jgi:hypothetical protein
MTVAAGGERFERLVMREKERIPPDIECCPCRTQAERCAAVVRRQPVEPALPARDKPRAESVKIVRNAKAQSCRARRPPRWHPADGSAETARRNQLGSQRDPFSLLIRALSDQTPITGELISRSRACVLRTRCPPSDRFPSDRTRRRAVASFLASPLPWLGCLNQVLAGKTSAVAKQSPV